MGEISFNEKYRIRTKAFAVAIIRFYGAMKKTDELRIVGKQLLRSGTSVAANFRAATRGRSKAEFYAKLCFVVEESDESLFWLELLEESALMPVNDEFEYLKQEAKEIVSVMATARKNAKPK